MNIDGDAARAARREAEQEPKTMTLGGVTYELPNELPARFSIEASKGDWEGAIAALLNGQAEAFLDEVTDRDLVEWFVPEIAKLYTAAPEGESSASGSSSRKTSRSSRQPSSATTTST